MRRSGRTLLAAAAMLAGSVAGIGGGVAGAAPPSYENLDPGGQPRLTETVPVNVVFVGYEPQDVPRERFLAELAGRYEPVVRSRLWYGETEKLGLTYTYDYRLTYADDAYEDRLFGELGRLARPAPLTDYQQAYNDQDANVRTIRRNSAIDAPSVERWLAAHAPSGVDTRRNTVYFINWFGRSDFRHHVYTKTDEPDPDTGYNFGAERDSRKLLAWGGTTADDEETGLGRTRRVWFHDLSAGPESWTDNWNVDDPDLDGDGVVDYRMPPSWEYRAGGFRLRSALASDLGKITRYVALDLLFTTSPIYPPELPTAEPPRTINLDSNVYEGIDGVNVSRRYVDRPLLLQELSELRPTSRFNYDSQDLPFRGDARRCYVLQLRDEPCYPALDFPAFANNYLFNATHLDRALDDQDRVDYELPIFNYAVPAGVGAPALGYADDDYRDGDQTFVFGFISPEIISSGYGLTTTMIHEVGHHLGMSHPHDGYDSASGVDFEPGGPFQFAWAGDESNSMMSYIDLNWDFSQFDRDNSHRFLAAAYNEAANRLAADVLADPDRAQARDELAEADRLVGATEESVAAHRYYSAELQAWAAYAKVRRAAAEVGVSLEQFDAARMAERASERAAATHAGGDFIDTIDAGPRGTP